MNNLATNNYTISVDFRGGKYIYQQQASDYKDATITWAKNLKAGEIQYIGSKVKTELINEIENDINENLITPINGTQNVWLCSAALKTGFAMVHIIKTSDAIEN